MSEILSVGIDIGTSTTSMVVSRFEIENTASCFSVPRVSIVDQEIIYRSDIYLTPLVDGIQIDIQKVQEILQGEYQKAGITPSMIQTGAVIITGESARKENAELVTQTLSQLAGDFVVATAGPDLESIIAAKGAGAQQFSEEYNCTVANLDIGGGTTNIGVFHCGELVAKGCYDIGGRLIKLDPQRRITYISPRMEVIARDCKISLKVGDRIQEEDIQILTKRMAQVLVQAMALEPKEALCSAMETAGSSPLELQAPVKYISFSGGVADYIYHAGGDLYRYGDIGVFLADAIRGSDLYTKSQVIPAKETIRATVVGAGSYTTTLSGSTITYSRPEVFPIKNVPAFVVGQTVEEDLARGDPRSLEERTAWFLEQNQCENLLFCLTHTQNPSYEQLCHIAQGLCQATGIYIPANKPILILTEHDFAKSLGQAMKRILGPGRDLICIDSVRARPGDYLDMGNPLMGGMAIPVVVKTLIFG